MGREESEQREMVPVDVLIDLVSPQRFAPP
jgi:hypothetical protein